MHPTLSVTSWLLLVTYCSIVSACEAPINASSSQMTFGSDTATDPETTGYTLNHFALNVNNITATMQFYGEVLGMRHMFTFHASDAYDITYMGYSHGGKYRASFQTGDEMFGEKNNIEGLIEFLYYRDGPRRLEASTVMPNTFAHVGLIVPDVQKTQERMERYGVKILKRVGEDPAVGGPFGRGFGLVGNVDEEQKVLAGTNLIGFQRFLIVEDPDGNLIEIQPQY